jgi:hypothetical protein
MGDDGTTINWRQLREFVDVDLTRSFILSWRMRGEALVIDIDLYLEPEHPFYDKPRPAEKVCIRPALLEFPYCSELSVDAVGRVEGAEISDKLGLGSISNLVVLDDGRYAISGEFGTVSVNAERPILRLKQL